MKSMTKWGLGLTVFGTVAAAVAYAWIHLLSLDPSEGVPIGLGIAIFFALAVITAGLLLLVITGVKYWASTARQE